MKLKQRSAFLSTTLLDERLIFESSQAWFLISGSVYDIVQLATFTAKIHLEVKVLGYLNTVHLRPYILTGINDRETLHSVPKQRERAH